MGNFAERMAVIPHAAKLISIDELKSTGEIMIRLPKEAWNKAEADSDCLFAVLLAVELISESVANVTKVRGTSLTSKLVTTMDQFVPKVNGDRIVVKTASILDRFSTLKNDAFGKTAEMTMSSKDSPTRVENSNRALQYQSSPDYSKRIDSYGSRTEGMPKRRSGSDTLTDSEDLREDSRQCAYETPPTLSNRSPKQVSSLRQDTLDEVESEGRKFARQHHESHIVNTLNMARSKSRSKLQQENIPEQGFYQRPKDFDPYKKKVAEGGPLARFMDKRALKEKSINHSEDYSSYDDEDAGESRYEEADNYDSRSVMPGDISLYSKQSSVKDSNRKWLEQDYIRSEAEESW